MTSTEDNIKTLKTGDDYRAMHYRSAKKYQENNKEKILQQKKEYYQKNKERINQWRKELREKKKLEALNNANE